MIAIEHHIDGLKSAPLWSQTDIDDGLTARLFRSFWHAFRDGAALYVASYWGAPGIGQADPGDENLGTQEFDRGAGM
jgi:hypothetical protein